MEDDFKEVSRHTAFGYAVVVALVVLIWLAGTYQNEIQSFLFQ